MFCSVGGFISGALNDSGFVSDSSKSISWKTGVKFIVFISGSIFSDGISKSFGSGNPFVDCADDGWVDIFFSCSFVAVILGVSNTECCIGPILFWARIN